MPRIPRASGPGRRGARLRLLCAVAAVSLLVPASSVRSPPVRAGTFVVLQMNLCNSGLASSCYSSGRSVDEAAEQVRRHAADLVAVQEVCSGDLSGPGGLTRAMADRAGGGPVSVAFTPVVDRDTGDRYRCTNGEPFGIAVVHRGAAGPVHRGRYASQDTSDEMRVWMCTTVDRRLTGCTTHLSPDRAVAVRQCRELMSLLTSPWVLPDVVVAGDLNLTSGAADPHSVRQCAPGGYGQRDDGAVQHILLGPTVRSVGGGTEPMRWTDHPALYATLGLATSRGARRRRAWARPSARPR